MQELSRQRRIWRKHLSCKSGIYPLDGETVTVTVTPQGERKVVVELPDIRDAQKYNYQSDLYAATPICVNIPK